MQLNLDPFQIGVFIAILLISITIHEFMHAYVAHKLGDPTAADEGRISFNPLKHIDPFMTVLLPVVLIIFSLPPILIAKPVPFNPALVKYNEFGSAMMAVAGPLSNLALAALGGLLYGSFSTGVFGDILELFIQLNVALFVFNMLPIPPLDGSRLLYAFAPEPVQRVMDQLETVGMFLIIFIVIVLSPVLGPLLGFLNEFFINLVIS